MKVVAKAIALTCGAKPHSLFKFCYNQSNNYNYVIFLVRQNKWSNHNQCHCTADIVAKNSFSIQ